MKHTRPIYLVGYIGETRLPRLLVDPGSSINAPTHSPRAEYPCQLPMLILIQAKVTIK